MKLYETSYIKDIRNRYGFRFSKSLGQNFLTDKSIIDEIIEGADIGPRYGDRNRPGIGVITREAARLAKRVIARRDR